jgi:hypothetical protein
MLKYRVLFLVEKGIFSIGITSLNAVAHGEKDRMRGDTLREDSPSP